MTPFPRFRVWHDNQMLPVHSLSWNQAGTLWHGPGHHLGWVAVNDDFNWTPDNPKPEVSHVMASLGHLDIDGQEIWDGDILSWCGREATLVVQYCEEYARWGGLVVLQDGEEVENDSYQWFDDYGMPDKVRVIGNIYQNPDLLKSE